MNNEQWTNIKNLSMYSIVKRTQANSVDTQHMA